MGAFLVGAGSPGRRFCLPNSRFLLQKSGLPNVFQGQATDIGLEIKNVKGQNSRVAAELAKMTGQNVGKIEGDLGRDFYLGSDEAVEYGLIDKVRSKRARNAEEPTRSERQKRGAKRRVICYDEG